jgi:hypothetical protein
MPRAWRARARDRSPHAAWPDVPPDRLVRDGIPQGTDAIARLLIVTLVVLLLANWRMRRLHLSGAMD